MQVLQARERGESDIYKHDEAGRAYMYIHRLYRFFARHWVQLESVNN